MRRGERKTGQHFFIEKRQRLGGVFAGRLLRDRRELHVAIDEQQSGGRVVAGPVQNRTIRAQRGRVDRRNERLGVPQPAPRQQGTGDVPGRVARDELAPLFVPTFPVDASVQAIQQVIRVQVQNNDRAARAGNPVNGLSAAQAPAHQLSRPLIKIRLVFAQRRLGFVHHLRQFAGDAPNRHGPVSGRLWAFSFRRLTGLLNRVAYCVRAAPLRQVVEVCPDFALGKLWNRQVSLDRLGGGGGLFQARITLRVAVVVGGDDDARAGVQRAYRLGYGLQVARVHSHNRAMSGHFVDGGGSRIALSNGDDGRGGQVAKGKISAFGRPAFEKILVAPIAGLVGENRLDGRQLAACRSQRNQ